MRTVSRLRGQLNRNRVAALAACLTLLLVLLFSTLCIALKTEHDCAGEDCPVCACLQLCEQAVRQLGTALPVLAAAVLLAVPGLSLTAADSAAAISRTPVLSKVRLNC